MIVRLLALLTLSVATSATEPQNFLFMGAGDLADNRELLSRPDIGGVQVVYSWRSLEVARDRYDFSQSEADLAEASKLRKQLFLQIQDRFFEREHRHVPNYLLEVDQPLVVPVGAKVRVLLTSNDVIHAWWVPAFGMKKDAIPGFVNELWFRADEPGTYRGQCAELCGRDHAFMPVVVEVKSQAEYDSWLAERKGGSEKENSKG